MDVSTKFISCSSLLYSRSVLSHKIIYNQHQFIFECIYYIQLRATILRKNSFRLFIWLNAEIFLQSLLCRVFHIGFFILRVSKKEIRIHYSIDDFENIRYNFFEMVSRYLKYPNINSLYWFLSCSDFSKLMNSYLPFHSKLVFVF